MEIVQRIPVPTGDILVVQGEHGLLECLSLQDYGQDVNVKADFLGLNRKLDVVEHTKLMPLEKKWVITISTQGGCSIGCNFCLPAGTLINTTVGLIPIEDIVAGDYVIGYDEKNKHIRINRVEEPMSRQYDGELIEITLANGKSIELTPEHEVYLVDGSTKQVQFLSEKDEILDF